MRIPLYVKLMVSYVVVVGAVLAPTFWFVRSTQRRELRDGLERDVRSEVGTMAGRLAAAPPGELGRTTNELLGLLPQRMTVVDAQGNVLGDSTVRDGALENHGNRPEIRAALASPDGFGTAVRHSATTGEDLLYIARRFPPSGPPRGVVRLAVPTATIDATEGRAWAFLRRAGGLALTAAVLLSFVAALVVSRPLRRIAATARAFAAGDLTRPVDVASNDELGEVATAIAELASQLRGRLIDAEAARAGLQALLDDLPVGLVVYDASRNPVTVSARAREVCSLDASSEAGQLRAIAVEPRHAAVLAQVLEDGTTREEPLALPWAPGARLIARWVAVFSARGERQPGLVVLDASATDDEREAARRLLGRAARLVRRASEHADEADAAEMRAVAEQASALAARAYPEPSEVETVPLDALCASVARDLESDANARAPLFSFELRHGEVRVVEASDRTRRAVRALLRAGLAARGEGGPAVKVRDELVEGRLRLLTRGRLDAEPAREAGRGIEALGGELGATEQGGELQEVWLSVPRA